jgi:hypothetical protein
MRASWAERQEAIERLLGEGCIKHGTEASTDIRGGAAFGVSATVGPAAWL